MGKVETSWSSQMVDKESDNQISDISLIKIGQQSVRAQPTQFQYVVMCTLYVSDIQSIYYIINVLANDVSTVHGCILQTRARPHDYQTSKSYADI